MMPRVHGLKVCNALKNDPSTQNIRIILLSALGRENEWGYRVGLDSGGDVLVKWDQVATAKVLDRTAWRRSIELMRAPPLRGLFVVPGSGSGGGCYTRWSFHGQEPHMADEKQKKIKKTESTSEFVARTNKQDEKRSGLKLRFGFTKRTR